MDDVPTTDPTRLEDGDLAALVASLLGVAHVDILSAATEQVAYDIPAITTAGRYLVRGTAEVAGRVREWSFFVKHVQEWSRSPQFADVPEEFRDLARRMVPWRTEGAVYRSDLDARLPRGLAMPRAVAVRDLDESSYAVWLEVVPRAEGTWDLDRYQRAAELLGRFAGSPRVRELATVSGHAWQVTDYTGGRLALQVLPALQQDQTWQHPLVHDHFAVLRARLVAAAEQVSAIAAELMAFPTLVGHGDGCPNNLLVRPDRAGFTMIDFGFFGALPVGFDLAQLLVGDVQIGRRGTEDLRRRAELCLTAYHAGLGAEGVAIGLDALRRAHALQLLLFTGLSTLPLELLDQEPTPTLSAVARSRAELAHYSLDLLDATA
jgi:hypothetical protein